MAASQGMFKVAHQTWCIDITSGCPDKKHVCRIFLIFDRNQFKN